MKIYNHNHCNSQKLLVILTTRQPKLIKYIMHKYNERTRTKSSFLLFKT